MSKKQFPPETKGVQYLFPASKTVQTRLIIVCQLTGYSPGSNQGLTFRYTMHSFEAFIAICQEHTKYESVSPDKITMRDRRPRLLNAQRVMSADT